MQVIEIAVTALISTIAASGIVTIIMRWFVENALKEAKQKREQETKRRQRRYEIEDKYHHAVGRCMFWMHYGVKKFEAAEKKGYWNGELQNSINTLQAVEDEQKELDRIQLAEINEPK